MTDGRYCLGCDLSCQEFMEPADRIHPHGQDLAPLEVPQEVVFAGPPSPSVRVFAEAHVLGEVAILITEGRD